MVGVVCSPNGNVWACKPYMPLGGERERKLESWLVSDIRAGTTQVLSLRAFPFYHGTIYKEL